MRFYHGDLGWRRRPKDHGELAIELDDASVSPADAKKYLQTVITGARGLITLRNQIMFLVEELWGSDPTDTPVKDGLFFYAWAILPCTGPPPSDDDPIFAHDVIFVRKQLSPRDIRKVQSHMRQLDFRVWPRKVTDPSPTALPFRWVRPGTAATENVVQQQ
jgi:hypothetical protein